MMIKRERKYIFNILPQELFVYSIFSWINETELIQIRPVCYDFEILFWKTIFYRSKQNVCVNRIILSILNCMFKDDMKTKKLQFFRDIIIWNRFTIYIAKLKNLIKVMCKNDLYEMILGDIFREIQFVFVQSDVFIREIYILSIRHQAYKNTVMIRWQSTCKYHLGKKFNSKLVDMFIKNYKKNPHHMLYYIVKARIICPLLLIKIQNVFYTNWKKINQDLYMRWVRDGFNPNITSMDHDFSLFLGRSYMFKKEEYMNVRNAILLECKIRNLSL